MKKWICLLFVLIMSLSLTGCQKEIQVTAFSYAEDSSYWLPGEWGMKTEGFHNVTPQEIQDAKDALALAEKEVTVTYNRTAVAWDEEAKIWRVDFWTQNQLGGDQIVYLNQDGTTKLSILGE